MKKGKPVTTALVLSNSVAAELGAALLVVSGGAPAVVGTTSSIANASHQQDSSRAANLTVLQMAVTHHWFLLWVVVAQKSQVPQQQPSRLWVQELFQKRLLGYWMPAITEFQATSLLQVILQTPGFLGPGFALAPWPIGRSWPCYALCLGALLWVSATMDFGDGTEVAAPG